MSQRKNLLSHPSIHPDFKAEPTIAAVRLTYRNSCRMLGFTKSLKEMAGQDGKGSHNLDAVKKRCQG